MPVGKVAPLVLISALVALLLAACTQSTPTPAPTNTPVPSPSPTSSPTGTPSPTPSPTATPSPSPTPTASPTETPAPSVSPTATPPAAGIPGLAQERETAENTNFGFSITHPVDWQAVEGPDPRRGPLLASQGPVGIRRLFVFLGYQDQILSPEQAVDLSQQGFADALPDEATFENRQQVTLDDGTEAVTYSFDLEGEVPRRTQVLVAARDSQMWEVMIQSARAEFDLRGDALRDILLSFRLQDPAPHGVAREEALTVYDPVGPATLDPHMVSDAPSHRYVTQVFSGLLRLDRDLALEPDLAESWEVTGDGTVFTFTLREGITFHDGTPITAGDFKWSFERAADPETGSPTARTYLGDIVGVDAMLEGEAEEISGVEVVDERTLEITVDRPKAYFLSKLTYPIAYVVDRDDFGGDEPFWFLEPNGSGPFSLKAWDPGQLLALERFEAYHRGAAGPAFLVSRTFGGRPLLMYQTGEADVVELDPSGARQAQDPESPVRDRLRVIDELSISYIGFNTSRPPFDSREVREAFSLALDREQLLEGMDEALGQPYSERVKFAAGVLPPGLPGHNPDLEPPAYDPDAARELLAEALPEEEREPITFTTIGATGVANLVADLWQENLDVEVQVEPAQSLSALREGNVYDFGWVADYPDPQNFLEVLFATGRDNNFGQYSSEEFDSLLDEAAVQPDTQTRLETYRQAEQVLLDDYAVIPLWHQVNYFLVKPYVEGWFVDPQGVPRYYDVELARES